jgi:hypothetical protein
MPFGLRNAGATYQRCMNHVFGEHIGRTVEAYVDDIVVKTRKASDLLSDLETTFRCLKAKGVKLNPEKCVFRVPRGMLLGFIVSERGIKANPEKIAAITNMGPIKDLKGVQRVMGCLAALSRFISRLGERGLPLYRLLRKTECFTWTSEAEEALGNLKALLTNAPILVPPAAGEDLLIYVAATTQVVSAAIVVERQEEGHALPIQRPVYFISEVLSKTKIRYPQIQKLLYAVIRDQDPLSEIKSQVLADFVAEWVDTQPPGGSNPAGTLDHVFRWVVDKNRGRCRPALHLAPRETPTLRAVPPFPGVQQRG